jgi:lipopolysaccharide export system permease protein
MRILSRYIFFEILVFFSISLATFTGLLLTIRMLRLTSLIINRGVDLSQIAQVFISIIPTFLEIALPMATLLGVMLAFARMCGDSEIVVMKASGISLVSFLRPIAVFALSVGLLSLLVSQVLRPWGFSSLSKALFNVARSKSTSGLNQGVFNKLGNITLYAEKIDYATGELARVLVDDKRPEQERKIVIAKRGRIIGDEATQSLYLLLGDGVAHELIEGKYSRTGFASNSLNIDADEIVKNDQKKGPAVRELTTPALNNYISMLDNDLRSNPSSDTVLFRGEEVPKKEVTKKFRRARVELGQRFSLPFASLVMAFVGMSLGIVSPRAQKTWGAGIAAALGLFVFVSYYSLFSVGVALADSGTVPIWFALWLPNIVTSLVAFLFIRNLATERWNSVPEGLQSLLGRILFSMRRRK